MAALVSKASRGEAEAPSVREHGLMGMQVQIASVGTIW